MIKVVIVSVTPVAGSPFQQYQCLKKYTDLNVRFIQNRAQYRDGRLFPKDLLDSEPVARQVIRDADVIHIHNALPTWLPPLINKARQRVIGTLHSFPRQGNWQQIMQFSHRVFTIRQPMQLREYKGFDSLPNLFDIWEYLPIPNKSYDGVIKIVYCPTNTYGPPGPGSKGYPVVMPLLERLQKQYGTAIELIHHRNVEYLENLRLKREGHITIDDICGSTFHLTSLEGCCTAQAILTSTLKEWNYPFVYTTLSNLEEQLHFLLENRDNLQMIAQQSRQWVETNWNPKEMIQEYVKAYGG